MFAETNPPELGEVTDQPGGRTMTGLEGAILVPILILGSAGILYFGLTAVRPRQLERRGGSERGGE